MNYGEIKAALRDSMGAGQSTDKDEMISRWVNAAYTAIAGKEGCNWWKQSVTIPCNQTSVVSMPSDYLRCSSINRVPFLRFPASEGAVRSRPYFSTGTVSINQGSATATITDGVLPDDVAGRAFNINDEPESFVIIERISDTEITLDHAREDYSVSGEEYSIDRAGVTKLCFAQPVTGDVEIEYFYFPQKLVQDTDIPLIPEPFHMYLVHAAEVELLRSDKERQTLWVQARNARDEMYAEMRQHNHKSKERMKRGIYAP